MVTYPVNSVNQNSTSSGIWTWDGTSTASTTALSQYYTVVGASTNTVENIAPGTSGYVLTSAGATSYPAYAALPYTQMPWSDKSSNFNAVSGNGYFITATCTAILPVPAANGAICSFAVDVAAGTGKLTITAGTGGYIRTGAQITATAASGGLVNNSIGDSITLIYRASDLVWLSVSVIGTWSLT